MVLAAVGEVERGRVHFYSRNLSPKFTSYVQGKFLLVEHNSVLLWSTSISRKLRFFGKL